MSFKRVLAYEASAGSGKTFNLVVRYLSLLFMGERASEIVTLTFTNKAANEMLERIVSTLENLQTLPNELEHISSQTQIPKEQILEVKEGVLKRFLDSKLQISTIDKFFGLILRKFAQRSEIHPNFTISDRLDDTKLIDRFLQEVEVARESRSLLELMALSDKRLINIYEQLSFLYAKKEELRLNIEYIDGESKIDEIMSIANSISQEMLSQELSDRGKKTMVFSSYKELLDKGWIFKESLNYWDYKKVYKESMDEKLSILQSLLLYQMRFEESRYLKQLFKLLDIYTKAREKMIKRDLKLSFDDVTLFVYSLLNGKIDNEFLYFRLDAQIKHILLDEFQDTSILQFDILSPLIDEIVSGKGVSDNRSFFFVGDVKQSIYRFRGGVSELFGYVANRYNVSLEPLKHNYRSKKKIVEFVNRVFMDKIDGYIPQISHSDKDGYVHYSSVSEPLDELIKKVDELIAHNVTPDDITILTLTNSDAQMVQEVLLGANHSVVTETTVKLIEQKNIRAFIEYVKYLYFNEEIYLESATSLLDDEVVKNEIGDVVKLAIWFFNHYKNADENSLIFIESISKFRDIEEFVFEIENLLEQSAISYENGIKVMTIHKSKGLEFKNVIVLDRLGQKRTRSSSLLFEYDAITLKNLYLRSKNRELIDSGYKKAKEQEEQLAYKDELNILYVALTRAENSLYIVAKDKNSFFEPLGLEQYSDGVFDVGDAKATVKIEKKECDYKKLSFGRQEQIKKLVIEDLAAVEFGLALHYTLEIMSSFNKNSLDIAIESTKNRYKQMLGDNELDDIYHRVLMFINDPFLQSINSIDVYKEQMIKDNSGIGVIDLLFKHIDRWVIVDYKSGEYSSEHLLQVKRYMNCIDRIDEKQTVGYLCYINQNHIKWVECL